MEWMDGDGGGRGNERKQQRGRRGKRRGRVKGLGFPGGGGDLGSGGVLYPTIYNMGEVLVL